MAVGNVNDAPLEMNSLAIKDMRLTTPDLQARIFYHYRQEVLRQLYRILGSADFIGNPVGLFTNVSSGVADIFYEPFNGVVMHGNKELGIGIAKVRHSSLTRSSLTLINFVRVRQVLSRRLCSDSPTVSPSSLAVLEKVSELEMLLPLADSFSSGLSAATFDEEYQNRRRMAQRRNKPRHAM
jgi:vacuolar protein sorting-associated protein 13A/C